MNTETIEIGRERLDRVFRYLEALNERRNPVQRHIGDQLWTLWLKDLPEHPSIQRGTPPLAAAAGEEALERRVVERRVRWGQIQQRSQTGVSFGSMDGASEPVGKR